jgi:DNA helicase-2/ATP-dependent DNA helicase PcrA
VTFSRTAVEQIRDRSSGVLSGIDPRVEIATFHGLAFRLARAFGRYFGHPMEPSIVGDARAKTLGSNSGEFSYADLLPTALQILRANTPIGFLLRSRWSLVICDEFQDTDDEEWEFLRLVASDARLLLLADPNQMIYGFKPGVTDRRLDEARGMSDCVEVELPLRSHRDPTQVLPAAALAIRHRQFADPAISAAVDQGRIVVRLGIPDDPPLRADRIAKELASLRADEFESFGVYAKTNMDAARLSEELAALGVGHTPVGFSEAFGESLIAQLRLVRYAAGELPWADVAEALAVVVTATVRSSRAPRLAELLVAGLSVSPEFDRRLEAIRAELEAASATAAVPVAMAVWERLGIAAGQSEWKKAQGVFSSLAARATTSGVLDIESLAHELHALRHDSFIQSDRGNSARVQLMNFSQTKGREADGVILSYSGSDFYGRDACEPFDEPSRIVYVSITRARRRVIVLLPDEPHPLVEPLSRFAR